MKSLGEMMVEVAALNHEKGWYDAERSFGDLVALLHSEVSEILEAFRDWDIEDATKAECPICTTVVYPELHLCKPQGVPSEMADVLIRLLDMCARYGINLETEYERKFAYNKTRPYRHGGRSL